MTIKLLALNNPQGEVAGHLLRQAGRDVQVSLATSEQDALQRLQREHFDLMILEDGAEKFLEEWRSIVKDADVLTLMTTPKDGPSGFVRAPLQPHEANAYLLFPFRFDVFVDEVNQLLAGASTQPLPGDEGYTRCQSAKMAVAFDYPAFWVMPEASSYQRATFQSFHVNAVGPKNRRDGLYSAIAVSIYHPLNPTRLEIETVLAFEFEWYRDLNRVTENRRLEVGGSPGNQAEYSWLRERQPGCSIVTTTERNGNVYVIHLMAAADRFDDFRPVYARLLETFQFLD